jgi:multiple sugar transport system permease protein/putative aldouronate transport system permease protein
MVIGTFVNVAATMIAAYPLSRRDMPFRGLCMFLFTFTMFFSGGLVPNYILMQKLNLIDTAAAMILPGAISVYNMIITRTFIQNSIPAELMEASFIDGCNDIRYFFSMVLPLSKAVIAVISLYYAVGHWNAYFDAFIYLNSRRLYPLQLFLREILVANTIDPSLTVDPELHEQKQGLADLLKYSLIVVSTVPMLIIYPFVQKYFIKGVMIGSLKG